MDDSAEQHPKYIEVDGSRYEVSQDRLSGRQLRELPHPPIPEDRKLVELVGNNDEREVSDEAEVEIINGLRFVSRERRFHIVLDDIRYEVSQRGLTGRQLHELPRPPIPENHQLFELVGDDEREVRDDREIEIVDGLRFVSRERHGYRIQIDRIHYEVDANAMTGAQLRNVPTPPIGPDRDLFEVTPGGSDRKIEDNTNVAIRNGLRFYTAPAHINPGASGLFA
jgi:hypothetical protein